MSDNKLSHNFEGICLYNLGANIIADNIIPNNKGRGIYMESSSRNNLIFDNNISNNNEGVLIYTRDSDNDTFFQNEFYKNKMKNIEDSINNWDNKYLGNYYSDFICIDGDGNGLCDSEHKISGEGSSVDRYPLARPIARSDLDKIL
ncbi:MAG: right-handed parallel beta-helix repeat-containing protein [Methanotrichaceae archaeon]|nr:right-handed parallel beta-helix repeat-containing protein [Methanotrichaceae archaeon]